MEMQAMILKTEKNYVDHIKRDQCVVDFLPHYWVILDYWLIFIIILIRCKNYLDELSCDVVDFFDSHSIDKFLLKLSQMGDTVLKYCGNKHFKTKIRTQFKKLKEAILSCPEKGDVNLFH